MKKRQYLLLILFQIFIVSVSLVFGGYIGALKVVAEHENVIYDGVKVAGIEVGGKTYDEALRQLEETYLKPLYSQNITFIKGEETFEMSLGNFYKPIGLEKLLEEVSNYPQSLNQVEKMQLLLGKTTKDYPLQPELDEGKLQALVRELSSSLKKESREASITIDNQSQIQLIPHQAQRELDEERFAQALRDVVAQKSAQTLDLKGFMIEHNPARTTEVLGTIDTMIASYNSTISGGEDRVTNVSIASSAINGIVLLPGEVFSFNDIVGDSTKEKGYKEAPIIVNKQVEMGIGGGVCQVSSTLYNAVLRTGLGSLQRQPHSVPLSYVPKGLDATVSYGLIDYQFENTLDYPIYIQSFVKDSKVYVQIYSNEALKGPIYELKTETYEVTPSPTQYVKDTTLAEGKKVLTQKGRVGYKVKVTREKYEEGKLVQTEVISRDIYKPSTTYYKIGTKKVKK